ncbi:putative 3-methyladenine DNA glycosylase isoform X3 [Cephus cinctus]|uniref:DNA-3-methyladenine glycosylase n=1 Tax=Cephus cinctus TaxID=211228 RepID=A0AAJ7W1D7_CEPCN|nr:putative 3-methyladenine DNA glycosylase isoform X3 [Cephus cinctus]
MLSFKAIRHYPRIPNMIKAEMFDNYKQAIHRIAKLHIANLDISMKRTRLAAKKNVLRETVSAAGETNVFNRETQSTSADNVLPSSKSSESSTEPSRLRTRLKLENLTVEKTTISTDTSVNEKKSTKYLQDKKKLRGVVDLEMMKNELKQLEDPPATPIEIELSSTRLSYDFFDVPCETLAQNMLGKILVRQLDNGTILKGRIVETESYLGVVDKASHTYQHRITPRNAPMYMPPGTIYVYLTYGMYHCFNVSSQESGAYVTIRALEPTVGLEYMELLRNICVIEGRKEKKMINNIKSLESHELCNGPSEICTALDIDDETFRDANIVTCHGLWIENNSSVEKLNIVATPQIENEPSKFKKPSKQLLRFYILGNSCISQRNVLYEKDACAT